jgi:hypothetical protein
LLFVATTGVHNDEILFLRLEFLYTVLSDNGGVGLCVAPVERDLRLGGVLLQLVKGTWADFR